MVGVGIAIGIDFGSYVYSASLREKRGEYGERLRLFDPDYVACYELFWTSVI